MSKKPTKRKPRPSAVFPPNYDGPVFALSMYGRMNTEMDNESYFESAEQEDAFCITDGPALWVATYKLTSIRRIRRKTVVEEVP